MCPGLTPPQLEWCDIVWEEATGSAQCSEENSTATTGRSHRSKVVWIPAMTTCHSQSVASGKEVRDVIHILAAPSAKWVDFRVDLVLIRTEEEVVPTLYTKQMDPRIAAVEPIGVRMSVDICRYHCRHSLF